MEANKISENGDDNGKPTTSRLVGLSQVWI